MTLNAKFCSVLLLLAMACGNAARAQSRRAAELSETEAEQIRESSIFPVERVAVFTRILEDRAARIRDLTGRPRSSQRVLKLDDALQDFTALMDETGDNLDQYSDRHSDIRKSLKLLAEAVPRWLKTLRAVPGEPGFELSRKEAIESGEELADEATRLLHEQEEYFATHKEEKGQERNDDQAKPKD